MAVLLLELPEVRRAMGFPPDMPAALTVVYEAFESLTEGPESAPMDGTTLLPSPSTVAVPRGRQRLSWALIDKEGLPKDPRANPQIGKTQISYLNQSIESRLSVRYQRTSLPLRVLHIQVMDVGSRHACAIQFWCGNPPYRETIELTAADLITTTFEAMPDMEEIDLEAVPWRAVQGTRPPAYYAISAHRIQYPGISYLAHPRFLLDRFGPQWWDPRVRPGR